LYSSDPSGKTNRGSFADAYDLFAVNFANILFGYVYYPDTGVLPSSVDVAIKMSSSVGTVMGQIGFGVLNDIYGRKKVPSLSFES
jgi:MFS transporter, PHS family, inorganic phosphate transporter